jgi:monomeric isocitrate dehydrogenase
LIFLLQSLDFPDNQELRNLLIRRAPAAVKNYAKKHPHSMSEWKQWSQTHVSHMEERTGFTAEPRHLP